MDLRSLRALMTSGSGSDPEAPLALSPAQAARAIGVSRSTLQRWTRQQAIPHVRVGRRVIYPVDLLREWLAKRSQTGGVS